MKFVYRALSGRENCIDSPTQGVALGCLIAALQAATNAPSGTAKRWGLCRRGKMPRLLFQPRRLNVEFDFLRALDDEFGIDRFLAGCWLKEDDRLV